MGHYGSYTQWLVHHGSWHKLTLPAVCSGAVAGALKNTWNKTTITKKGNYYTNYVERWTWRWGWIPPEVRTEVRDEDTSEGNVLRLFHHGKGAALPCLCHAGPRLQTTPRCLRRVWTLSSLTCAIMLAVTVVRSFSCVRVVFIMRPQSFIQVSNLFEHRGSSCSGGTEGCMYACAAE